MSEKLIYRQHNGVAVISIDDGKVNALDHAMLDALFDALAQARQGAGSVLLAGRPERFCAGFDLAVMTSGPDAMLDLVSRGADFLLQVYEFPRPVVAACTGHAVAAGALILLGADLRIGALGPYRIGLNEVQIGMQLPAFADELARARLTPRHYHRATVLAELFEPTAACDAGFLDRTVSAADVTEAAFAEAVRLAALPDPAFRDTKAMQRAELAAHLRATLPTARARQPVRV